MGRARRIHRHRGGSDARAHGAFRSGARRAGVAADAVSKPTRGELDLTGTLVIPRSKGVGGATRAAAGFFLMVCLLTAASCSSLIGADDYQDSAAAICGMVSVCYGEDARCVERTRSRLDTAAASVRATWLTTLSSSACLSGCTAARSCLDLIPMCNLRGACTKKEDCCGFLTGQADCEQAGCCGAKGLPCRSNADCCPSLGCDPAFGTCGGDRKSVV